MCKCICNIHAIRCAYIPGHTNFICLPTPPNHNVIVGRSVGRSIYSTHITRTSIYIYTYTQVTQSNLYIFVFFFSFTLQEKIRQPCNMPAAIDGPQLHRCYCWVLYFVSFSCGDYNLLRIVQQKPIHMSELQLCLSSTQI